MTPVLILRPEPGAGVTAARARARGLTPAIAPLFEVRPLAWEPPEATRFDAMMLTSANAPRHAGPALALYADLPCFAVGEATAAEARRQGLRDVRSGPADAAALVEAMAAAGIARALHLCGRDHVPVSRAGPAVEPCPVYAAEAVPQLPAASLDALGGGALVLVHSPRAGDCFGRLADAAALGRDEIALAAISPAAAAAAGPGWRSTAIAPVPRDEALLELAEKLCKTGAMGSPA